MLVADNILAAEWMVTTGMNDIDRSSPLISRKPHAPRRDDSSLPSAHTTGELRLIYATPSILIGGRRSHRRLRRF